MTEILENLEDSYRYNLGKKHGISDKENEFDSDLDYLKEEKPTTMMDDDYITGYEVGYLEGPKKKKRKA
jgi:hypothetical protein